MLSRRQRNLLLLTTALLIAGQGSALGRRKKKHRGASGHQSAPAKTPSGGDRDEPESGEGEPAGSAQTPQAEPKRSGEGEATPAAEPEADDARPLAASKRRPPAPANPAEAAAGQRRLPPALQAGLRFGGLYRHLSWTQVSSGTLDPFSISGAAQLGLRAELYPAALVGRDFGANLGAVVSFDRGLGVTVRGPSGDVSGIFQDYLMGLKIRFPLGFFVPHASVSYGGQAFLFSPRLAPVPSVFYTFVRLAAGARLQLTNAVDLDVAVGYLPVIDAGKQSGYVQSTDYFPAMSSAAFDASGSLGVRVVGIFGLRGGVDFRQYALQTSNSSGMFTAQGATDRFLTPWLMVEIVLDGAGPHGGGPED